MIAGGSPGTSRHPARPISGDGGGEKERVVSVLVFRPNLLCVSPTQTQLCCHKNPAVNFIKLSATYNPCLAGQTMPGQENGPDWIKAGPGGSSSNVPVIVTVL